MRLIQIYILLIVFLVGCNSTAKITSFEQTSIQVIQENSFYVDCSSVFRKPWWANSQTTEMKLCEVKVTDMTSITDKEGNGVLFTDLSEEDKVQVVFKEETRLDSNKQSEIEAKEIILLQSK